MTFSQRKKSPDFPLLTEILTAMPTYVLRQSQLPIINLPHTAANRQTNPICNTFNLCSALVFRGTLGTGIREQGTSRSPHIICLSVWLPPPVCVLVYFYPIVAVVVVVFVDCSLLPPSLSCLWLHFACCLCVCVCLCALWPRQPAFPEQPTSNQKPTRRIRSFFQPFACGRPLPCVGVGVRMAAHMCALAYCTNRQHYRILTAFIYTYAQKE